MVDNINIPLGVEKVLKVEVIDTSAPLRRLLIETLSRLQKLETQIEDHETRITTLEP